MFFVPQQTVPAGGPDAIRNLVKDLNFANCNIDLEEGSVDAQKSGSDGVIVVVTGMITLKGEKPRFFIQTFFLANQRNHQFYVRNTIMRLMTPPATYAPAQSEAPEVVSNGHAVVADVVETPVEPEPETQQPEPEVAREPEPKIEAAPVEVTNGVTESAPEELVPAAVEEIVEAAEESVEAADATPSTEPPTVRSYAAMLKSGVSASTLSATKPAPATAVRRVVASAPATSAAKNGTGENSKSTHSIYVKQFPEDTTSDELKAAFAAFGDVKAVELSAKGFAFVDLSSAAALQAILASPEPITIRGSALTIEERNSAKTGNRAANGGGGGGGGASNGRRSGDKDTKNGREGGRGEGGRDRGQRRGSDGDKKGRQRGDKGKADSK
jgi:hypothetical protein